MGLISVLQTACKIMAVFLTICYSYQVLYLFLPLVKKRKRLRDTTPRRYAILIAARNEESVLPHLLESIANQQYPAECITTYVVADNCTDRTAEVARRNGARVFVRNNLEKIGKGYALHDLLEYIRQEDGLESFDDFLIFDADNLLKPDYVAQINRVSNAGYEAFCGYRNTKNFGTNWLSAGYGVWYLHDSAHMNQSRMLMGTCCAVSGTGFGFTRQLLERMGGWNFYTLTEDIEFSTWCATHGVTIGYSHDAILYDEQPFDFGESWRQRTRWTQGGIQIAMRYSGSLVRGIFQGGRASWSSYEMATLSCWGIAVSGFSCAMTFLLAFLLKGWFGVVSTILLSAVGIYLSTCVMGALTVFYQWNRILAKPWIKIGSIFAFPLFMMSFIPIAFTAIFRKFQWQPTRHSVAVSMKVLEKNTVN